MGYFWDGHRPTRPRKRQYISAIFYHDELQKRIALETKAARQQELGEALLTIIEPADIFYLAEEYHQKHSLRWESELLAELQEIYPDFADFNNSTAVARLNGLVRYHGDRQHLQQEIASYGLSLTSQSKLLIR